jgi:hypothetical protein
MGALGQSRTRAFTPDEVLRMVAAGVLAPDEPVELIEGRLVVVSPSYRIAKILAEDDTVSPPGLGVEWRVRDLLP